MSRRRRRWAWPGCSPQETTESDQKTVKKVKLSSSQTKPDDATRTEEGLYFRQLLPVTGLREAGPIWQTTPPRCNRRALALPKTFSINFEISTGERSRHASGQRAGGKPARVTGGATFRTLTAKRRGGDLGREGGKPRRHHTPGPRTRGEWSRSRRACPPVGRAQHE